jgi:hypothetical protein
VADDVDGEGAMDRRVAAAIIVSSRLFPSVAWAVCSNYSTGF